MLKIKITRECDFCDKTTSLFKLNRLVAIGFDSDGKPKKDKGIMCDQCFDELLEAWQELENKKGGEK